MYRAARALIIKPPKDDRHDLATISALHEIRQYGIIAETVYAGNDVDLSSIESLPDIVILDAGNSKDCQAMATYSHQLHASTLASILPIVMVGSTTDFGKFDVNLHLDHRTPAPIMAKKLKHVIRIAAMKLEYRRRIETARKFGVTPPELDFRQTGQSPRLLVIGKGERYFQLASIFKGTATLKYVPSFEDARQQLASFSYDCLIIDTLAARDFTIDGLKEFKLNPRTFNLPVLLMQEGLPVATQEQLAETGICDLFDLHDEAKEIVTFVQTLLHAEHIRQSLIRAFKSDDFSAIRDQATNLPRRLFFEKHLEQLLRQSRAWNIPVAFGLLRILPSFESGARDDAPRRKAIFSQVGQTIASLVRVEDIATHLGDGKFVIAAPNSTGLTISVLIGRIRAILQMTAFSAGGELGKVEIDTHYFESRPHDTLLTIIEGLNEA